MFPSSALQLRLPLLEEDTLRYWKTHRIFEKAVDLRQSGLPYRAAPLPPAPVRRPDLSPAVEFAVQDLYLRYKAMRGYRVTWGIGWNAHDPQVELGAGARLGLAGPRQIAAYGLGRFHDLCRRSAFDYLQDWERLAERMGLWCDWERVPVDLSNEQIDAVWGVLKELWERSLLYADQRTAPYCPRCATSLGSPTGRLPETEAEQVEVILRLPLVQDPGTALLVWTTQPWALPANVAVAAHPDHEYVIVEHDLPEYSGGGTEKLILARKQAAAILGQAPVRIFESFRGSRLKGLRYQPLFTYLLPDKPAYQVVLAESVAGDAGTGLVPLSPPFSEQACQAAQAHNLPVLHTMTREGTFINEIRPWRGLSLHQAAPLIVQDLQQRGLVFQSQTSTVASRACPACGSPLIDTTQRSWSVRTLAARHRLASLARQVEWHPASLPADPGKAGLVPAADWLVGRAGSWGAPLPVWECQNCHQFHVTGSLRQLAEQAKLALEDIDPHRPAIDSLLLACPDCGEPMQHLPEVLEPWFERAVLALSQAGALVERPEGGGPPLDLVCAVADPPSDWLAALHLLSGLLSDQPATRQIAWLPAVSPSADPSAHPASSAGEDALTPLALLREQGADALRWAVYLQPVDSPLPLTPELVNQAGGSFLRGVLELGELLNSRVDLHQFRQAPAETEVMPSMQTARQDDWLRSRLNCLVRDVTTALEAGELCQAAQALQQFVLADLVGWYVPQRLTLRGDETFPAESYRPLFAALAVLSRLMAPLTPFLAEHLYQGLVRGLSSLSLEGSESVHLTEWPTFDPVCIQPDLEADMAVIQRLAELGGTARQGAALPLHQPLAEAAFVLDHPQAERLIESGAGMLMEALNVRQVRLLTPDEEARVLADETHHWVTASGAGALAALAVRLTPELVAEGLAGEFILRVQELRQKAGLAPNERIRIVYTATQRLAEALEAHQMLILASVQAVELRPFDQKTQARQSEMMKSLFTITEFRGEKLTFGIEKV